MKLLKKFIFSCFLLSLLTNNLLAKEKYVIATATAGGTYYPVGVGIATIASLKLSASNKMVFSAVTSAGSAENLTMLQSGEADLAIIQGLFGSMAWQGKAKYEGDVRKDLRAISMLWHEVEQFTVLSELAETGNIKDLKNLYGKKFSIGGRNSGARVSTEIILDSLGISYNKMNLEYLGYAASANALIEGKIDGVNPLAGVPTSAVCNLFMKTTPKKLQILEFTKEDLLKVNDSYPIWTPYIIKADTYHGQTKDIHTIAQPSLLVATKDMSEEAVYQLTKVIYENLDFLHEVHKATKPMSIKKAIVGSPIPLHPGAARFYRENGIDIADDLLE